MLETIACLALLHVLPATPLAPPEAEIALDAPIVDVTVFSGSASVRRRAPLPAADGTFVLPGLPHGLDPDSVRVRCTAGEVVGVEVRERIETSVPDERIAGLRDAVREVERAIAVLSDERSVLESMEEHVHRLLRHEEQTHVGEVREGRVDTAAWEENFRYLKGKLTTLRGELRELGWRSRDKELELRNLQLELGRFESSRGTNVRDVVVDVIRTAEGEGTIEVEYVVGNAGWMPVYDLRARQDLSRVELVYRAKVWQRSGEDWKDVDVVLSTARPRRGARGPEPRITWLDLFDPRAVTAETSRRALRSLGYAGEETKAADKAPVASAGVPLYADVSDEGLSLRYRLARRETIESRDQPHTVLVGRESLRVAPEHYCVPAFDTTVWLRAQARNTSPWVLLPGRAAVYFGNDFIGHADLDEVQLDQELTLHLGPDPGLVVSRTKLDDLREASGMFSSKATLVEAWRIEVENHGAFTPRADGAVQVIVHEALPRATDDRIVVKIAEVTPALQEGERWQEMREEKGALTWILRVPKGGKQVIELATEISYPENRKLIRR
jgi:uncharacterized protein (TIGR02231 family)